MLRDAAVALAKQRLRRPGDTALSDRIILEMQVVQRELEQNLDQDMPWFLLSEDLSTQTISGEERVEIPGDMLREYEDGALFVLVPISGKYLPLKKDDFDVIDNRYKEVGSNRPRAYAQVGKYFILRPTPDIEYTIKMRCYLADALLTSNIENKWLKYTLEWFLAEVCTRVAAMHLEDLELAQVFASSIPGLKTRVYRSGLARKMANMDMTIGDDP